MVRQGKKSTALRSAYNIEQKNRMQLCTKPVHFRVAIPESQSRPRFMGDLKIAILLNDMPCGLVPTFRSKLLPLSSGLKRRNVARGHISEHFILSITQF
jgi:hypothetical protein